MLKRARLFTAEFVKHRYGMTFASYIISAFVTGLACVVFMRLFSYADTHRLDFAHVGWWCLLLAPLLMVTAVLLVRRFAPYAAGSGIPQAIFVVRHGTEKEFEQKARLMASPGTMAVKIVSIIAAVWAGASVGREGPTVQIAVCVFFLCMGLLAKFFPITADPRSMAVAGGAAGLAAAFNTPLAGVTFAVEELAGSYFENIKDYVLMAIIVAAISAKILTGDYVYFGKLSSPPELRLSAIIVIGIIAGLGGALFASAILRGGSLVSKKLQKGGWKMPVLCAWTLLLLAWIGGSHVFGPGNEAAGEYLKGQMPREPGVFAITKLLATIITYWSGVAGGIFAPSLAMGAGISAEIARFMGYPVSSCALIGMAAFLSGAIQTPITAFVIVFELTGHPAMLLPVMLSALIAHITVRGLKARNLYSTLAERYVSENGTAL